MRIFAFVLLGITLVVAAFFGYCYYGAQMQIVGVAASLTPATEALGTYELVTGQMREGSFYGTVYQELEFTYPESYTFVSFTVRMRNRGLLPMDWIRIEVAPEENDILQLAADRTPSLAGGSTADFSTALLCRSGADADRKITLTYYVLGYPFRVEYGK